MSLTITHLSFTRLKNLAHSPKKLLKYLTQDYERTDAMVEGSLLDCLLFEPDMFDARFYAVEKPDRRTKEGKALWEAAQEAAGSRELISTEQLNAAKFLETSIRENSTVAFQGLLNPDFFKFQVECSFKYKGFLHKGVKDADGVNRDGQRVIWDLKRMGAKSGEKDVRYEIRKNKYDLQAAIYCHELDSENIPVRYFVIAVDNEGYVTPFEISRDSREQVKIEWAKLIAAAHRCNMTDLDAGPEFWADRDGFFQF